VKPVQSETSATTPSPRVWIFQANPKKYRIEDSLNAEASEYWSLNQHAEEVHDGDRVLIWLSGANAGIYALGTVVGEPILQTDSSIGIGYWRDPAEGKKLKPRVLVRYDEVFLDCPLEKGLLQLDPLLSNMRIMRFAQGTNFPVTVAEWQAITARLRGTSGVSPSITE
jgi:EVE domain-containing protein